MHVTIHYAALFGLLFVALSMRSLRLRVKLGIAIGGAGNQQMLRAIRIHSKFAEYLPLAMLLTLGTIVATARLPLG
jgi:uncharacterized protein